MNSRVHDPASAASRSGSTAVETPGRRRLDRSRTRVTIGTLLALVLLAGCGVRLDGPAPLPLVPDADEISRQATVVDVVAIHDAAEQALAAVPADSPVATALTDVVATADRHTTALGGVYSSGLEADDDASDDPVAADDGQTSVDPGDVADGSVPTPEPTTLAPTAPEPSAEGVVALLVQAATRTRGSISTPDDPALARLYASVATSQLESAQELATAAGIDLLLPDAFGTDLPETLPHNLTAPDLATLVRSEDAAGYAYEVMAARLAEGQRTAALARAAVHRERAQGWAVLASLDGTATDPRQVAYTLPPAADGGSALASPETMSALAVDLETTLATTYATFVGLVDADTREAMLDLLVDTSRAARAWGGPLHAFPGMPEQA